MYHIVHIQAACCLKLLPALAMQNCAHLKSASVVFRMHSLLFHMAATLCIMCLNCLSCVWDFSW